MGGRGDLAFIRLLGNFAIKPTLNGHHSAKLINDSPIKNVVIPAKAGIQTSPDVNKWIDPASENFRLNPNAPNAASTGHSHRDS